MLIHSHIVYCCVFAPVAELNSGKRNQVTQISYLAFYRISLLTSVLEDEGSVLSCPSSVPSTALGLWQHLSTCLWN